MLKTGPEVDCPWLNAILAIVAKKRSFASVSTCRGRRVIDYEENGRWNFQEFGAVCFASDEHTLDGLVFGWRSAILLAALAPLIPLIFALSTTLANRRANRTLAALLLVMAGIATPWMIGFAGFYDKWQGLSFVPFALPLAVVPLLWLYVRARIGAAWPANPWWHLLPAALQAIAKIAEFATGHIVVLAAIGDVVLASQTIAYGWLSWRDLQRFRRDLANERSSNRLFAAH